MFSFLEEQYSGWYIIIGGLIFALVILFIVSLLVFFGIIPINNTTSTKVADTV